MLLKDIFFSTIVFLCNFITLALFGMQEPASLQYQAAQCAVKNNLDIKDLTQDCKEYLSILQLGNIAEPCVNYLPPLKSNGYFYQAKASVILKTPHIFDILRHHYRQVNPEAIPQKTFDAELKRLTEYAVLFSNEKALQFLLDHKPEHANLMMDKENRSPLMYVTHNGADLQIAKLLIENGADPAARNSQQKTVLMHATAANNKTLMKLLLEKTNNIDALDLGGRSALHFAAQANAAEAALYLLEKGVPVDAIDNAGNTALLYAAYQVASIPLLQILLNKNAVIDHQNNGGQTALHYAAKEGNLNNVKFLCERNANINLKNRKGQSSIESAIQTGENCLGINLRSKIQQTINYLRSLHKEEKLPSYFEIFKEKAHICADYTISFLYDFFGVAKPLNCIIFSITEDEVKDVQVYLDCDTPIDAIIDEKNKSTMMHVAAEFNSKKIIALALKYNASLQIQNKYGQTPLMVARLNSAHEAEELIKQAMRDSLLKKLP